MHQEVEPGNIDTGLIEDLTEQESVIIASIIEGEFPKSKLKPGQYVPVYVDGRDVRFSNRMTSAGTAQDLDGFYYLLNEALADKQARENITAKDRLIFTEEYPPTDARSETITYKLVKREPATVSQGKQMNRGRQNWRRQLREIIPDPHHPNKKLYIYGLLYDNVIELCCWARTNKAANARALWLERLVDDYAWYFKYKGISAIRFQGRTADMHTVVEDNKWHCRPLRYYVRTERISTLSEYVITQLILNVTATSSLDDDE